MSWEPEIEELRRRKELAERMGGEENVARQHGAGRLTVRERIGRLLDPESFREVGALAGAASYAADGTLESIRPSNVVMGSGRIDRRPVVVSGDDFTVRGGAADAAIGGKQNYAERMARELRVPMVRLVDGTGGGGSVKSLLDFSRTYVPWNPAWEHVVAALTEIPVVALALGPVAGLGAARVVTSHFSVMVKGSAQLFVAGPPLVAAGMNREVSKEDLGGSSIHARGSGAVDNEVATEDEALALARRFLGYLPANVWQQPPRAVCDDAPGRREEALLSIVPRDRRKGYDARRLVELIVDRDSFLEVAPRFGRPLVAGLARIAGFPVAVLANDPRFYGGGLDAAASEKLVRMVDLADTFHLPVVSFVDQPGFVIGVAAEKAGTIRKGAQALAAVYQASVPWASVLVRRCFGVAGAAHQNHARHNFRIAWPSGDWGSLPIEGGLEAAFKRDLAKAPNAAELKAEILAKLEAVRSPFRTAEAFLVEDIVDPRETRTLLAEWVEQAYAVEATRLGVKQRGMRP